MGALALKLLGNFRLSDADGRTITITNRKTQALLAYLALGSEGAYERTRLADLLWGDRPEAQARQNLRQALSTLRKGIGETPKDILQADETTVSFAHERVVVDAKEFQQRLASNDIEEALRHYRGDLLEDHREVCAAFDAWLAAERQRLRQAAEDAWQRMGAECLERGDADGAIDAGRRLIHLEPLREPAHRLLMRGYELAGRRTEALQHYKTLEAILHEELDAKPDAESQRLVAAIRAANGPAERSAKGRFSGPRPLIDRPSIAVLPFENMSKDPDQEHFADGITDDIITALSKSSMFFVIARNSTFTYKGANVEVRLVAEELGVQYVVEGSVRRAGDQIRITTQLIDAVADRHIWAEHYDFEMQDVFEIQDKITSTIATAIAPEYLSAEKQRAERKPVHNLDAWDHYIRAYWHFSRFTRADNDLALELIAKAVELDPYGAGHHGLLSIILNIRALYGWTESRADTVRAAREAAETAVALDDRDARALRALGMVDLYARRTDAAIHHFERAIDRDPFEAENHALLGNAWGAAGNYEEALRHVEYAVALSPRDAFLNSWYNNLAMAAVAAGRDAEAVGWARKTIAENPQFPGGHRSLAAAHGRLGQLPEAKAALATLLRLLPGLTLADLRERLPLADPTHLERYLDGLRTAGLPD